MNPDLSALAAVIFNRKSMRISVYKDVTVSTSITRKLMTRPKLSRTMQPETSRKVEWTMMILYYVSNDNIFQITFSNAIYSVFKINLPNFCCKS